MSGKETTVSVSELGGTQSVATFTLNGYNIEAGGVFGTSGAMRSFKVIEGDIANYWLEQIPLEICDEQGNKSRIRIFAAPANYGGFGFVEFL